jgi:hypothetical protein
MRYPNPTIVCDGGCDNDSQNLRRGYSDGLRRRHIRIDKKSTTSSHVYFAWVGVSFLGIAFTLFVVVLLLSLRH